MHQLQRQVRVAFTLCLIAFAAGIVAHLALTDIFHGEPDVRLEWRAVQATGLIVAATLVYAARTLAKVLAATRGQASASAPYNDR